MFAEKIYIKCNIWKVAVRPSYIQDAWFLKVNKAVAAAKGTLLAVNNEQTTQSSG
jgi:hypothetical protein